MTAGTAPRFVTLEGGEGAGKSTQLGRLAAELDARGIRCISTREPGGSPGAEEIRNLLVRGEPGRWDAITETLLMFAARTDHIARTIRPALDSGQWVLCDRFTDSTYAYQGAGRGLDREIIARIERAVVGNLKPDLTLILDLPPEEGLKRAHARVSADTRFEKFDIAFHEKLRQTFQEIARRDPARCTLIDASGNEDSVAQAILQAVQKRFQI